MDILKYKGYEGTAELDVSLGVCRGKILFIDDLVTYQSKEVGALQAAFEAAVDDYLETCKELGREPQTAFKGLFNVRVSPALHKALALRAVAEGVTLNEVVVRACDAYTCVKDINHNHHHTLTINTEDSSTLTRIVSSSSDVQWEEAKYAH
jgi:predicted HicB family RNase H-like nuclease